MSSNRIDREDVVYHPYCNEPIYLKSLGEKYHLDEIEERLTDKWILLKTSNTHKVIIDVRNIINFIKENSYLS